MSLEITGDYCDRLYENLVLISKTKTLKKSYYRKGELPLISCIRLKCNLKKEILKDKILLILWRRIKNKKLKDNHKEK